jgi:hypothetical protein
MGFTGRSLTIDLPRQTSGGFEAFTRAGFAAKGIVYVLIGGLALMAALGEGGRTTDSKGAVAWLARQPFGQASLFLVGAGLLGYAAWRFVSAFRDPDGFDAKALAKRAGSLLIGGIYTSTAIYALRLAIGEGGNSGGSKQAQTWTARVLSLPFGELLVMAVGAGIIAAGLWQMHRGWKNRFTKHLRELPPNHDWVVMAGRWGHIARGVVFGLSGWIVIKAAWQHNPRNVRGIEGALDTISGQPSGQLLLGLVAAGLACYGAWSLIESRYRQV